jgi:hypothetical protein
MFGMICLSDSDFYILFHTIYSFYILDIISDFVVWPQVIGDEVRYEWVAWSVARACLEPVDRGDPVGGVRSSHVARDRGVVATG